jgi:hypothetical protein
VVQVPGRQRVGKLDGVARAGDVEALVGLVGRGHVVDRGEVEEVLDLAAQRDDPLVVDPEARLREVADDGLDALWRTPTPAVDQRAQAVLRPSADQHVDIAVALEQSFDEMTADEAGRARHEIRHCSPLRYCRLSAANTIGRRLRPDPATGRRSSSGGRASART